MLKRVEIERHEIVEENCIDLTTKYV